MPVEALVDDCPLYDLSPERPPAGLYPAPSRTSRRTTSSDPGVTLLALLASPNIASRLPLFRAVRLHRAVAHGAPARAGRRRGARAAGRRRDRGLDRRLRAARRVRPVHGHRRGGARVHREPRLRRRRAAGPDELPELRQPREAAHRLAADGVDPRPRRRLPRARRAGRRRQRLALQRERRRPDLPDAGRRHGRRAARRRRAPGARASRARATRSASPARSSPRCPARSSRSCAARSCPSGCRAIDIAALRAAQEAIRDAVRAGALSSAHDVAEGGFLVAVAESCLAGGDRRDARPRPATRRRSSAIAVRRVAGVGASSSRAREEALRPAGRARRASTSSARSAATRSTSRAATTRIVAHARRAADRTGALAPLFP